MRWTDSSWIFLCLAATRSTLCASISSVQFPTRSKVNFRFDRLRAPTCSHRSKAPQSCVPNFDTPADSCTVYLVLA
ncbi:hypothetical protein C8R43DRAFT_988988 [Mycena crocata]|nr:hypothetical protein C8R43DRAFT_988988 [Mycena crocata]